MTPPAASSPTTSAVVLSGGGATGAYEVGVLKGLCGGGSRVTGSAPLRPAVVTGTSIGGFNGAVLVSELWRGAVMATTQLEQIWLNTIPLDDSTNHNHVFRFRGDPFEFLNARILLQDPLQPVKGAASDAWFFFRNGLSRLQLLTAPGSRNLEARFASMIDFSALIDNEPSVRLVEKSIDPRSIRESGAKLRIVATDWTAGGIKIFENADMTDDYAVRIVLSSTAIPGVFPPVSMDGVTYVDGGVLDNTPLLPAIRAGADTLHVIYLDPAVEAIPVGALSSTLDSMSRMVTVQFAARINSDINRIALINRAIAQFESSGATGADAARAMQVFGVSSLRPLVVHRYHPKEDLGQGILGWLDFRQQRIQALIDRGLHDAVEHDCRRSGCVMADGTILSTSSAAS